MSNEIRTEILVSNSRHTLNATFSVQVRNLYHLESGLVQPSGVEVELTRSGVLELMRQLEMALDLDKVVGEEYGLGDYLIQKSQVSVDGTTYDTYDDYLEGKPQED
jgi:hypothetical protein